MDKFKKDDSIMSGKGEDDVVWVTINGAHIPIKDGESLEKSVNDLTKKKKKGIVILPKKEYAKFCHAIRTWYADKIPKSGDIFLENHYYIFDYNRKEERLVCKFKIPIEGNRILINRLEEIWKAKK